MAVDITSNNVKHSSETRSGVKVTKIAKCHIAEEKKMIDLTKNQNNVNLSRTLIHTRNRNSFIIFFGLKDPTKINFFQVFTCMKRLRGV